MRRSVIASGPRSLYVRIQLGTHSSPRPISSARGVAFDGPTAMTNSARNRSRVRGAPPPLPAAANRPPSAPTSARPAGSSLTLPNEIDTRNSTGYANSNQAVAKLQFSS